MEPSKRGTIQMEESKESVLISSLLTLQQLSISSMTIFFIQDFFRLKTIALKVASVKDCFFSKEISETVEDYVKVDPVFQKHDIV